MRYKMRTMDHPYANDRSPQEGDRTFFLEIDLEDHGKLTLELGQAGVTEYGAMLAAIAYESGFENDLTELANKIVGDS